MSGDETYNYAPKSPDLSSFYSAGPTQPAPQLEHPPGDNHRDPEYKSEPQPLPRFGHSSSYVPPLTSAPAPHRHHHHHYHHHQHPHPHPRPHPRPHPHPHPHPRAAPPSAASLKSEHQLYPPAARLSYLPPTPNQVLPSQSAYGLQPRFLQEEKQPRPLYGQPYATHSLHSPYAQSLPPAGALPPASTAPTQAPPDMPPRKAPAAAAPVIEPSPVRTKFPTARIKRIMQADEEVGKVAQQTPIAVGKALELFMIQMVTKSADIAKEKGSKRVTAHMLKQVVETDEQWDFLRDIVSRVEHEKEGAKAKAKTESSSDDDMSEPKKRTRGGRRKKTA